jgi:membrane protease YdiL (CAAX protease family)
MNEAQVPHPHQTRKGLLEEVLFRGYALRALEEAGVSFWRANLEAAALFALLHLPGWLFQGHTLTDCLALAAQVGFLGFLFGAVRAGGATLWSSVVFHALNNAWRGGWLLLAADWFSGAG